jgi:hypothetical protein
VDGTSGTGPGFWIQTTPGVSGKITATPNISSRDVLGVTNKGEDLGTVLLVKLEPGKQVYPHSDSGWSAGYYEKYFIPIQTSAKATFNFPDGVIAPELGHVYWFDNSILHSYTNNTPDDVIMLIVTIRSDKVQGAL